MVSQFRILVNKSYIDQSKQEIEYGKGKCCPPFPDENCSVAYMFGKYDNGNDDELLQ